MASYYDVLEISKNASSADIKKAYKRLAIKWHPDKNPQDPEKASEMFKMVAEAYETLSDPEKRRIYDMGGMDDKPVNNGRHSNRYNPRNDMNDFYDFHRSYSEQRAFDIFNQFFRDIDEFHNRSFSNPSRRSNMDSLFSSPFDNDPFFSGFGIGGNFGLPLSEALRSGNTSFAMSSSSFSSGFGSSGGRSTSTSTFIDSTGRKTIRTETTITYPDGRKETSIDERVEEPYNHQRIGSGNNITRTLSSSTGNNKKIGYRT